MCARIMLAALVEHFDKTKLSMLLGLDCPKNRQAVALGQEKDRVKLLLGIAEFSLNIFNEDRHLVVKLFNREVEKCGIDKLEEVVTDRNILLGIQRVDAGEEE